ncbi:MAG: hypothetical protein J2P15_02490 [Micromonosporaceae bacterium]|nr:hypothetical protein [Micromonosporaceae bacterium]
MLVTAVSPDGGIRARIGRAGDVEMTFVGRAYRTYNEANLAHQLARLGALAWVAYDRALTDEHRGALGQTAEEFAEQERRPKDDRRQRYDADLAAVEADGASPDGWLRIRARGMLRWDVQILSGALRLPMVEFLAELHAAVRALFADREVKATIVKARYYDLGIPSAWRDLLIDPDRVVRSAGWEGHPVGVHSSTPPGGLRPRPGSGGAARRVTGP